MLRRTTGAETQEVPPHRDTIHAFAGEYRSAQDHNNDNLATHSDREDRVAGYVQLELLPMASLPPWLGAARMPDHPTSARSGTRNG